MKITLVQHIRTKWGKHHAVPTEVCSYQICAQPILSATNIGFDYGLHKIKNGVIYFVGQYGLLSILQLLLAVLNVYQALISTSTIQVHLIHINQFQPVKLKCLHFNYGEGDIDSLIK